MLKDKLKINKATIKIDGTLLDTLKSYCQKNGLKINWFVEQAILERLQKENK